MVMSKVEEYKGILIYSGAGLNPGSGTAQQHEKEYKIFQEVLDRVDNKHNPLMIELGSHWALWSLCFKHRYKNGFNILVELFKSRLEIGTNNFKLNGYDFKGYHGGILMVNSDDVIRPISKTKAPSSDQRGVDIDIKEIFNENKIDVVDILHMDIQGSELAFIKHLNEINLLNKFDQLVIGTHSNEIHNKILDILKSNSFEIFDNIPWNIGDGLICAKYIKK
jgi:FkbM family methyltransferase